MPQNCTLGKFADHRHIFSVYAGKIPVSSADSLGVSFTAKVPPSKDTGFGQLLSFALARFFILFVYEWI